MSFRALVLSVARIPAESWWWEGLQEAWPSSQVCYGHTLCPGAWSGGAARGMRNPLVRRKAMWFLAQRRSGPSFCPWGWQQ